LTHTREDAAIRCPAQSRHAHQLKNSTRPCRRSTARNKGTAEKPYTVLVDDNFHYIDESERYKYGTCAKLEEAVPVCQAILNASLQKAYKPRMSVTVLYEEYVAAGEDPFVRGPGANFSAWSYAKLRCEALCGGRVERSRA
jgi:hypothetical protein